MYAIILNLDLDSLSQAYPNDSYKNGLYTVCG